MTMGTLSGLVTMSRKLGSNRLRQKNSTPPASSSQPPTFVQTLPDQNRATNPTSDRVNDHCG